MFDRLLAFKAKHGHCLVPNRYDEDRSLGAWVSTQRRHYKAIESGNPSHDPNSMTEERVSKLREIGFVWATYSLECTIRRAPRISGKVW